MAATGRPISVSIRLEIKHRRSQGETVRQVAGALNVSKTTVQKYWNKRGTNSLNAQKESA